MIIKHGGVQTLNWHGRYAQIMQSKTSGADDVREKLKTVSSSVYIYPCADHVPSVVDMEVLFQTPLIEVIHAHLRT